MEESRRSAIVTGSSRGVGAATARLLAERGFNVVINYSKSEQQARTVQAECEALGASTLLCRADVSDDNDCRRMAEETLSAWGRIDALVNNAGTTKFCAANDLEGLSKEDFLHVYSTNLIGPYQMIRAVAAQMKNQGRGAVVNVSSIAGVKGIGSSVAYCASKAALINMTLCSPEPWDRKSGSTPYVPASFRENGFSGIGPELYEMMKTHYERTSPLQVTATPEIVAKSILYLIEGAEITTAKR